MRHLVGRFEKTASEYYHEYQNNEENFNNQNVKNMSRLTHNLLRGLDYDTIYRIRSNNMEALQKRLGKVNQLSVKLNGGSFMYPLYLQNGEEIRKKLIEQKIYVPVLWNDTLWVCQDKLEQEYVKNILPLPVDQRYTEEDMEYIANTVLLFLYAANN